MKQVLVQTEVQFQLPDENVQVPTTCNECAASCPLKADGCAFDLYQMVRAIHSGAPRLGVAFEGGPELAGKLKERAVACRSAVVAKIQAHNAEIGQAIRVARIALRLGNGKSGASKHTGHANPEPSPPTGEVAPQGSEGSGSDGDGDDEAAGTESVSRGDDRLYLSDEDKRLEADILARRESEGGIYAYAIPDTIIDNIEVMRPEWEKAFSQAPFSGIVGIIPKRHAVGRNGGPPDPNHVRVTIWYRGPPGKEGSKVIKERLAEFRARLKKERRQREGEAVVGTGVRAAEQPA